LANDINWMPLTIALIDIMNMKPRCNNTIGDSKTSQFARGYLGEAAPVFLISPNNNFIFLFYSNLLLHSRQTRNLEKLKCSREAIRADKDRNVSPVVLFALSKVINLNKKLKNERKYYIQH